MQLVLAIATILAAVGVTYILCVRPCAVARAATRARPQNEGPAPAVRRIHAMMSCTR